MLVKTKLDCLHHSVIRRNKYLGVSITKEIANSVLRAVESCIHAGFAMIKLPIIRWIGKSKTHIIGCNWFSGDSIIVITVVYVI